jgi:hypothetical protein
LKCEGVQDDFLAGGASLKLSMMEKARVGGYGGIVEGLHKGYDDHRNLSSFKEIRAFRFRR